VNPYGRYGLDMNARLPLLESKWPLVTRLLGLTQFPWVYPNSRAIRPKRVWNWFRIEAASLPMFAVLSRLQVIRSGSHGLRASR